MSNPKIKFDHNFTKLHGQKTANLRYMENTGLNMLTPEAVIYDTEYVENGELKHSRIHNGQLIRLEFFGDKGIPFTTYRKYRKSSFNKYYRDLGQVFDIVVEEK